MKKRAKAIAGAVFLFCAFARSSDAAGRFLVFDYQDLRKSKPSWTAAEQQRLTSFEDNNKAEVEIGRIMYLIIPDEATRVAPFRTWAVVRGACNSAEREINYLQQVSVFDDTLSLLWQMRATGAISAVNDSVVLDDEDMRNLVRLAWLNRESGSNSAGAGIARLFDSKFVSSESRRWFFDSPPGKRLLIVKGLTTSPTATVYLCLPDHKGPTPFFEVVSYDRTILSRVIEVLRADSVPAALTLNLKFFGVGHVASEVTELEENIDVHFRNEDGTEILASVQERKAEGDTIKLVVSAPRGILSAKEVRFILTKGEFQVLDPQQNAFSGSVSFEIPEPHKILGTPASFDLWVAKVGHARDFQDHGLWSSTARLGDLRVSIDFDLLIGRYTSQLGADDASVMDLFDAPQEFLARMRPDPQRRERREQDERAVISTVNATREIRDAVWRQVLIGLARAKEPGQILLIKNVGGATTSVETRDNVNRYFALVRSFLELKLRATPYVGVQLLESERRVRDPRLVGAIDVVVVPNTGS